MTIGILYTVTALDEYDRKFNYSRIISDVELIYIKNDNIVYRWTFEKAIREILRQMGEAAWAYWYCTSEELQWEWNLEEINCFEQITEST